MVGIISAIVYLGICAKDISYENFIKEIHDDSKAIISELRILVIWGFVSPIIIMAVCMRNYAQDKQMGDKILRWIHKLANLKTDFGDKK